MKSVPCGKNSMRTLLGLWLWHLTHEEFYFLKDITQCCKKKNMHEKEYKKIFERKSKEFHCNLENEKIDEWKQFGIFLCIKINKQRIEIIDSIKSIFIIVELIINVFFYLLSVYYTQFSLLPPFSTLYGLIGNSNSFFVSFFSY